MSRGRRQGGHAQFAGRPGDVAVILLCAAIGCGAAPATRAMQDPREKNPTAETTIDARLLADLEILRDLELLRQLDLLRKFDEAQSASRPRTSREERGKP